MRRLRWTAFGLVALSYMLSLRTLEDYGVGLGILLAASLIGLIAAFFVRETFCRYLTDAEEPVRAPKRAAVRADS